MTRCGRLDLLWLDFSFGDYRGERWGAEKLVAMVRKHQPAILLNNRLDVIRSLGTYGVFVTPGWTRPLEERVHHANGPVAPVVLEVL